jgi:hypothetical protein
MANGDEQNAGGCIINGGNQSSVACSNDTNDVKNLAGGLKLDLRWLVFLCIMLNLGFVVAADETAGGCIINGATVNTLNCSGNTQNDIGTISPATSNGLSDGDIAGIVIGAISAMIALLTLMATIVNKYAVIGTNRTPLGHFKRAPLYRIVEGCTFLFGCGTLDGVETAMRGFVERGGLRSHWVLPEYNAGAIEPEPERGVHKV